MPAPAVLDQQHVAGLLATFDLGTEGRLSDGPVARGRLGSIWRLDTERGSWAVKQVAPEITPDDLEAVIDGAAFQEAAVAAGVPAPAVRRTLDGRVIGDLGVVRVRIQSWVDIEPMDLELDPGDLGRLVAALHQAPFVGTTGTEPWYETPVGATRWSGLLRTLRAREAPFAQELAALVPEVIGLEALLGSPPRSLRTCHRDLWADNVRRTSDGGLCVFDFDNAGLADPAQELALVLTEYAGDDPVRAAAIQAAYAGAGGPARVLAPADFAMVIAQQGHIVEEGCRRWLAATTDADRADNEAWVREFIDRPLTQAMIEALLAAR